MFEIFVDKENDAPPSVPRSAPPPVPLSAPFQVFQDENQIPVSVATVSTNKVTSHPIPESAGFSGSGNTGNQTLSTELPTTNETTAFNSNKTDVQHTIFSRSVHYTTLAGSVGIHPLN